jgi:hypothetical protein
MNLRLLALLLPLCALPALAAEERPSTTNQAQHSRYQIALQSLHQQRYAKAYGDLVELADVGHAPSAQLALVLHDHGAELFGQNWSATPEQRRRWFAMTQRLNRARSFAPDSEARE